MALLCLFSFLVYVACEEDDDFLATFEKLVNENVSTVPRAQQKTIVAPIHVKPRSNKDSQGTPTETEKEDSSQSSQSQPNTMQFSVLLRKGAKQTFKNFDVPIDSELSKNLQKQEREDRLEKERVKQLTLQINERQEEEEVTETLAAMQRPSLLVHREPMRQDHRRPPQPHKGTPNVDWIFKSKGQGGGS